MIRSTLGLIALLIFGASASWAQNSVYAVNGLGFPGRPVSPRSRALGGSMGAFDRLSQVNPAAASGFQRVTAMAASGSNFRNYSAGGVDVNGLEETRFPLVTVGGGLGFRRLDFAVGFSSYAERTFDVSSSGTTVVRGDTLAVEDRIKSDGGIADVRGAVAFSFSPNFAVGAALHFINGSTRTLVVRDFESPDYRTVRQEGELSFSGLGFSAGATIRASRVVRLALFARFDTELDSEFEKTRVGSVDLPSSLGGAVQLSPLQALRWTTAVSWRSWSDAASTVGGGAVSNAFDTWEFSSGVEIGGLETGTSRMPIRFGFRWAQLPFSPTTDQAREIDLSFGTAIPFAANRASIDLAVERAFRDGGGAEERAWYLNVGLMVTP